MSVPAIQSLNLELARVPEALRLLLSGLTHAQVIWKPSATEFSMLEHLCHLNDLEQEGHTVRIHRILEEESPFLPDIDGEKLAVERSYDTQEVDTVLPGFARARRNNCAFIARLTSEELERSGELEGVGRITLAELLHRIQAHDKDHLGTLKQLRAAVRQV